MRGIEILRYGAQTPTVRLRGQRVRERKTRALSRALFCSLSAKADSRRLRPIAGQFIATALNCSLPANELTGTNRHAGT